VRGPGFVAVFVMVVVGGRRAWGRSRRGWSGRWTCTSSGEG